MGTGQKIKYLRKKAQFTQSELAEGIISVPYLSLIENEKAEPPNDLLKFFAEKFNVNIDYLLNSEQNEASALAKYQKTSIELQQLLAQNNFTKAKEIYNQLVIDKEDNRHSYKIEIHINFLLTKYYLSTNQPKKANDIIKEIKEYYKSMDHNENISFELFSSQGSYSFLINDYMGALNYFMSASKYTSSVDDKKRGQLYYNIALVNSILSYSAKSIFYGEKSLEVFSKEPYLVPTLNVLLIMGINYRKIGEPTEAKVNFERVLSLSTGNDNLISYRAKALHNLGRCELRDSIPTALDYFIESLKIKQGYNDQNYADLAITLEQVANCYYKMGGPYPLALQYILKVKELLKEKIDTIQYGSCRLLEGMIHKEMGKISTALDCFYASLRTFDKNQDFRQAAETAEQLAYIFQERGEYEPTTRMLFKANNYRKLLSG